MACRVASEKITKYSKVSMSSRRYSSTASAQIEIYCHGASTGILACEIDVAAAAARLAAAEA